MLEIPWWVQVVKYTHQEGIERVDAPMLFTTREEAKKRLRDQEGAEAGTYLRLVEKFGEDEVNEAWSNTPATKIFEVDEETLLDDLQDSDFLCVRVEDRLRLREDFAEELRKRLREPDRHPWWRRVFGG